MTDRSGPTSETVLVEGADAAGYVDSQCTQDLSGLEVGGRALTLLLDPTGSIVTIAAVRRPASELLALEVPAGTAERTVARLERFAIRADVAVRTAATDDGDELLVDERSRIEAGVPGAAELARGLVPHALDAGLREQTVSFTKGCYPGQELVARMEARHATPPYVLRRVTTTAPVQPGDPAGDASLDGAVTSVVEGQGGARWVALCVLHRRDASGDAVEVRTAGGTVVAQLDEGPSVRS